MVDGLLPVLCLIAGICLPVVVLILVLRRAQRQLSEAHAYREVSRRLGLTADTRGISVHGHLGDRRLWIGSVMVGHGPDRRVECRGVLGLRLPLGLGMVVRRRGRSLRRSKRVPVTTGVPVLDRALEITGDDRARVADLLGAAAAPLGALLERWPDVTITDHELRVQLRAPESSPSRLEELAHAMVQVAEVLESARAAIAMPDMLVAYVASWEALGGRVGLGLRPELPALQGSVRGHRVVVAAYRATDGYAALIEVWFPQRHRLGLRLTPQQAPDGYWSVGQDIQVGDASFDAAFVVKGWDPQWIRHLLGPGAREALLDLLSIGPVEVDDLKLQIRGVTIDADALEPVLQQAVDAATTFDWDDSIEMSALDLA